MKVGIIGNGFVGSSHAAAFSPVCETAVYDIEPEKSPNTFDEVADCDVVFVCVPTPTDYRQDVTAVVDALELMQAAGSKAVIVIKSTVLPGTTRGLQVEFKDLRIVFSPEFLTQRTARLDMMTCQQFIVGGDFDDCLVVDQLIRRRFHAPNILLTDHRTAELVKYMRNCFFATKISVMNEFRLIAEKVGANWRDAVSAFVMDARVADSHVEVPGPDGRLGYGGACFPKDMAAMVVMAGEFSITASTLIGAIETNNRVRNG